MSDIFENDIDNQNEDLSALEDDENTSELDGDAIVYPDVLYKTRLEYSNEGIYVSLPQNIKELQAGEYVIIPTRYGKDLALVLGKSEHPVGLRKSDIVTVSRKANADDLNRFNEYRAKEAEAFKVFKEKAAAHNLDMKLVAVHFLLEELKALFFFLPFSSFEKCQILLLFFTPSPCSIFIRNNIS